MRDKQSVKAKDANLDRHDRGDDHFPKDEIVNGLVQVNYQIAVCDCGIT